MPPKRKASASSCGDPRRDKEPSARPRRRSYTASTSAKRQPLEHDAAHPAGEDWPSRARAGRARSGSESRSRPPGIPSRHMYALSAATTSTSENKTDGVRLRRKEDQDLHASRLSRRSAPAGAGSRVPAARGGTAAASAIIVSRSADAIVSTAIATKGLLHPHCPWSRRERWARAGRSRRRRSPPQFGLRARHRRAADVGTRWSEYSALPRRREFPERQDHRGRRCQGRVHEGLSHLVQERRTQRRGETTRTYSVAAPGASRRLGESEIR